MSLRHCAILYAHLDAAMIVVLATTVNHDLQLSVSHRAASHADIGHHGHLILAIIKRNHGVDRVCNHHTHAPNR